MFPEQPSNLLPLLTQSRPVSPCTAQDLATALHRLHRVGVRRGFLLVAPTRIADRAPVHVPALGNRDEEWWAHLCERIGSRSRLAVVLIEASARGLDLHRVQGRINGRGARRVVIPDAASWSRATPSERTALLEIARGLCTDDQGLVAKAFATHTPAYGSAETAKAIRHDTLDDLLLRPEPAALAFTA